MKPQITRDGLHIQTFSEVFNGLVEAYRGIYGQDISVDQDDPDGQRIGIEARLNLDLQQLAASIYNSLDPDFDDGLMRVTKLCGLSLKPASVSQWDITIESTKVLTLPKGYTVLDELDQEWVLTDSVVITAGTNTVTFLAKDGGRVEGVQGSVIKPVTIVLGITSLTAVDNARLGRNEETPMELRQSRERSLQNPAYSVVGSLFAKLGRLNGVTDLSVYENDQSVTDTVTNMPAHSVWVIVEGGRVADIVETIVKQKTAGVRSIGEVEAEYIETFIKPNGEPFLMSHKMRFDRPNYVDLHISLKVKPKIINTPVDSELIKKRLLDCKLSIGEAIQAGQLYDYALLTVKDDFIITDLKISKDGITFTDEALTPALNERFILSLDRIMVVT